jgi:hypothetical protein
MQNMQYAEARLLSSHIQLGREVMSQSHRMMSTGLDGADVC